jgi:hypothetical protein
MNLNIEKKFKYNLNLKVYEWMVNSVTANVSETDTERKKELLKFKYDEERAN